ncbi:MAG: Ldh family oxidoreductase [Tissierellia bacterium]|nr:Ldh family oxidoreductase [Tissierellia bacterium]
MNNTIFYDSHTLSEFCINVLIKAGIKTDDAKIITDSIIFAELRNISSHGVVRLSTYVERIEKDVVNPNAEMVYLVNEGAIALLDANNGIGQVAGHKAMTKSISIAQDYGIGMVVVKNSNHFGVASYYSMIASEKGMIGIVLTNASPAIAPYGTKTPLLGTNPLTVAIPANKEKPIVLDMAMSTVARGKIRLNALKNQDIPIGWALDEEGNATTDSNKALRGSLLPIGGVKGSALSLIIDILCGVLSGTSSIGEVKNITDMSGPSKTGHVFMAIDITKFISEGTFTRNIDLSINTIKSLTPLNENKIYMPGEIEMNLMEERKKKGIPLDTEVINSLNNLAERYGVSEI